MRTIFLQGMASRVHGKLAILKGYQGFETVLGSAAANTGSLAAAQHPSRPLCS